MEQKPIYAISAIVAALFLSGVLAMGGHNVKAYERTCHYWSNGDSQCENGPFFGYTQPHQATIHQVDNGYCGQRGFSWENCGYEGGQPQIQQAAFFPNGVDTNNCFWSYPVQCN
jgi:hypothetical protein